MANTFELISAVTVGSGGAASIDFTSIPATYTDLCVKLSGRSTYAATSTALWLAFNGLNTNRSSKTLFGNGSTATSGGGSDQEIAPINGASATSSTFTSFEVYIPNYVGSSYKSFSTDSVNENNATAANMIMRAGLWSSTSAINQLTFSLELGNFAQYSTAYLYGVKNA